MTCVVEYHLLSFLDHILQVIAKFPDTLLGYLHAVMLH